MKELKNLKLPFRGVALAMIVFGAGILATGIVAWKLSFFFGYTSIHAPFEKVMGGAIIVALGYVILELELLRNR